MTTTPPIRGYFIIPRPTLNILYLHTKFGDFRFSRSGDMTAGVEIENGSSDLDHAHFRGGLSHERYDLILHCLRLCKI